MADDPCKVLVIDDHRDCADSAVLLLRLWGHEAVAAYSSSEALALARSFVPDVVLVDIGLPGKDGVELGEDIQKICPASRLIALTGFTRADIIGRTREAGFVDHLTKPTDPSQLKEVVGQHCSTEPGQTCE